MSDEWIALAKDFIANPHKAALTIVLLAGTWRMWRWARKEEKEEGLIATLLRERSELQEENRLLRKELHEALNRENQ